MVRIYHLGPRLRDEQSSSGKVKINNKNEKLGSGVHPNALEEQIERRKTKRINLEKRSDRAVQCRKIRSMGVARRVINQRIRERDKEREGRRRRRNSPFRSTRYLLTGCNGESHES